MPVVEGNTEAIRLFKEFGVDYSAVRCHSANAIDTAKHSGNGKVIEALREKQAKL